MQAGAPEKSEHEVEHHEKVGHQTERQWVEAEAFIDKVVIQCAYRPVHLRERPYDGEGGLPSA